MNIFTTDFFFSIIRIATPILFATLAAVISEKGGVTNIGLEGIMMMSALFGSLGAYWTGNWFVGLLIAMAVGLCEALLMGFFAFNLKTDIILTGTAINMIGSGGTLFLVKVITGGASTTNLITKSLQVPSINIPGIKSIPVIGAVISGHSLLTYLGFLFVFLTWVLLYKTPLGLNIRSVGENPNAASSVGVSVMRIRYITIGIGGILAGMGGAFMSMYYAMGWSGQRRTAGRYAGGSGVRFCAGFGYQGLRDRRGLQPGSSDPVHRHHPCTGSLRTEPETQREKALCYST